MPVQPYEYPRWALEWWLRAYRNDEEDPMTDEEPKAPTLADDLDRAIARLAQEMVTDERMQTFHALDHLKSAREWLRRRDER